MVEYNYRIYPVVLITFLKIAVGFTLELAIPLYYIGIGMNPIYIGLITSASWIVYLFSPLALSKYYLRIGIKRCLLISVSGSFFILFMIQFTLEPLIVFFLFIGEGLFAGFFWPVLITNISIVTARDNVCEDDSQQDKLTRSYNLAWNIGAIFSYLTGTILLLFISDITVIFRLSFIYAIGLVFFAFFIEDPKPEKNDAKTMVAKKKLIEKCDQEKVSFPKYLPYLIIFLNGFLIGALILLYPLKANQLNFVYYSTFLFNFFRMIGQTLTIYKTIGFSIKRLSKLVLISLIVLPLSFLGYGLNINIIIFGILFIIFGIFVSIMYSISFNMVVYQNIIEYTAKYSSFFETSSGLGFFLAPIITGIIAGINVDIAFFFLGIITTFFLIFFFIIRKKISSEKTLVSDNLNRDNIFLE